jgi:hypothetical protein
MAATPCPTRRAPIVGSASCAGARLWAVRRTGAARSIPEPAAFATWNPPEGRPTFCGGIDTPPTSRSISMSKSSTSSCLRSIACPRACGTEGDGVRAGSEGAEAFDARAGAGPRSGAKGTFLCEAGGAVGRAASASSCSALSSGTDARREDSPSEGTGGSAAAGVGMASRRSGSSWRTVTACGITGWEPLWGIAFFSELLASCTISLSRSAGEVVGGTRFCTHAERSSSVVSGSPASVRAPASDLRNASAVS